MNEHQHKYKIPYFTEGHARTVARSLRGKAYVYICRVGGQMHWHVTSMPPKRQKEINKKFKRKEWTNAKSR